MRVAIEIQPVLDRNLTGVGWYTDNFIRRIKNFAREGENFYLLGMDFYGKADELKECLSPNVHLKTNGLMHYGIYRRIWRFLPFIDYGSFFRTRADIFHFFNFVAPPYVRGKIVITVYDMVYKVFPETMEKANYVKLEQNLRRSCDAASAIVTISENSRREIIEYMEVDAGRIHIIPPGVDCQHYRPPKGEKEVLSIRKKYGLPQYYFLYLGTIEPRKNIESLVEAFRIYRDRGGRGHLVIAGKKGWMYEKVFDLVKQYGLENHIVFPGYIDEQDKPLVYGGARAFLFPSLYEGFGMPPLEAMACGIPVVTSNTSSLPEVVGNAGLMVEPADIEGLALYMKRLEEDEKLCQELREKGLKRAAKFTWEDSVKKLMELYRTLEE